MEEKMIMMKDIRPDNPDVVSAIVSHGYAVVTQEYLEQCSKESAELARMKMERGKEK
ncbi:MAG: hypothetical protein MJ095_00005 [Oscillospiraceae bacterium]|nr:hypothetical protein [Oscillospiraceae bacterium]